MNTNKSDQSREQQNRDSDLAGAEIALKRAAIKAREDARKSGTAIVTIDGDGIKEEYPGSASSEK